MCGETNRELRGNADFWSNNDAGQICFGNNYSFKITLMVYTVREDFWESEESLELNLQVRYVLQVLPHPVLIVLVDLIENFIAFA